MIKKQKLKITGLKEYKEKALVKKIPQKSTHSTGKKFLKTKAKNGKSSNRLEISPAIKDISPNIKSFNCFIKFCDNDIPMSKSSIQTHFIEKHRVRIADREAQDFVDMFHGKEQQQLTMGGGRYRLFRTKDGQMFRVRTAE